MLDYYRNPDTNVMTVFTSDRKHIVEREVADVTTDEQAEELFKGIKADYIAEYRCSAKFWR